MNPTKNLTEDKLGMNPTKNLIEPKFYRNPTKNLIEPKLYRNPTKNLISGVAVKVKFYQFFSGFIKSLGSINFLVEVM
jgi:hypothetical protein